MKYSKLILIVCFCYFLTACYGSGVVVLPKTDSDDEITNAESPQNDEPNPGAEEEVPEDDNADPEPTTEAPQNDNANHDPAAEAPQNDNANPEPVIEAPQNDNANPEPVAEAPQNDNANPEPVTEAPQNDNANPEPVTEAPQNDNANPEPVTEAPQNDNANPEPVTEAPQNDNANSEPVAEAPPEDEELPIPEIEYLNAIVEDELRYQNVLGGAIAIVRDGAIVHAKGYGFTSPEMAVPITTETVFRWASISKTLTAIAALQLDEATDNFSIDDVVSKHVDYWPSDASVKSNVTIKQLLSHRAGIIHYRNTGNCPDNPSPDFDRTAHGDVPFNARQAVNVFAEQPLCFNPGNRFRYSTFGFSLAAAALEQEAGRSYADWVHDLITAPLGLRSLTQGTGISTGYQGGCGELTRVSEASKSYVLPGGGWASDITDLARFANGILQGALLNDTERLWKESTGNSNSYRLGIDLSVDGQTAWHTGGHGDLKTFMHLYPNRGDKAGVVVYLNNPHSDPERLAKRVADALGISSWSVPLDSGCQ